MTPVASNTSMAQNKMAQALTANPSILENYWKNNPGTLGQAVQSNSSAFPLTTGGQGSPAGISFAAPNIHTGEGGGPVYLDGRPMDDAGRQQAMDWAITTSGWDMDAMRAGQGSKMLNGPTAPVAGQPVGGGQVTTQPTGDAPTLWGGFNRNNGYNDYIDMAFGNARRLLDPYMDRDRKNFEQSMINKGLAGSSEGYNEAMGQMDRRHNDMLNDAAFHSMGFGAQRFDADRNFDLGEFTTMDGINRAWDAINFRNAGYNDSRADHRFNQQAALLGMTPVSSFQPYNIGASFQNANNVNAYNQAMQNNAWQQVGSDIGTAIGSIDWGKIFNSSTPPAQGASSQTGGRYYTPTGG